MIQLATAPNASRMGLTPAANDGKANPFDTRRRTGHPWPFLSSYCVRPQQPDQSKASNDSGS